ncbi:MAG: hypothetical protein QOE79_776 [Sphingomonadales bacterium]|nr:hypothetical protein [Sphingomonadales bacterium]
MFHVGTWTCVLAGLVAVAPAAAPATNDGHDRRADCFSVSGLLEEVVPDLIHAGDVVVQEPMGIPVDIFAPAAGAHGTPRRLTAESVFWKKAFAPGIEPSPELVSDWLAVQQYSATACAGALLARRRIGVQPHSWSPGAARRRVVLIGYPAFDRSGRDALLYVMQGGPYLTGEATLLRYAKAGRHWKEVARVYLGSS